MPLRRRVLIIVNPVAGRGRRSRRRLDRVVAALQQRGCAVVIRRTAAVGDAERLAAEAEADFEVVVGAGGDGTLNAVANRLAGTGRPLAVLPLGTANVLAREIGLPRNPERLAELIAVGPARPIWPGRVGNRLFLMMASSGFDAETVATVNSRLKRRIGRFAFAWAIGVCWWRDGTCELSVRIGDVDHHAATVIAAKGRRYAGSFVIAPRADLAEPMLDFVLFRRAGRLAVLRYLGALFFGRLPRRTDVSFLRARDAFLSAPAALPVQADGEIVARLPARISIAEYPLLLIRP